MPTNNFFRLPYHKKAKIIKSAVREFTKNTLENASLNNIIIDSDVARGSFYYYFDNKEDLYFYLLERHSYNIQTKIEEYLIKYNGNLYKTYISMFDFFTKLLNGGNNYIKNIFKSMNGKILHNLFIKDYESNERLESLVNNINIHNKSIAFKTLNTILASYIVKTLYSDNDLIEIKIEYRTIINLITSSFIEKRD